MTILDLRFWICDWETVTPACDRRMKQGSCLLRFLTRALSEGRGWPGEGGSAELSRRAGCGSFYLLEGKSPRHQNGALATSSSAAEFERRKLCATRSAPFLPVDHLDNPPHPINDPIRGAGILLPPWRDRDGGATVAAMSPSSRLAGSWTAATGKPARLHQDSQDVRNLSGQT